MARAGKFRRPLIRRATAVTKEYEGRSGFWWPNRFEGPRPRKCKRKLTADERIAEQLAAEDREQK